MLTNSILGGIHTTGPLGDAVLGLPKRTAYQKLPACIGSAGHRFAISADHKDRSCCEHCGLIRTVTTDA